MAKIILGAEALTVVRLQDGSRVNVHKGQPVPASADSDDVKRLLKEKYLTEVDVAQETDDSQPAKEPTVKEILTEVGEDKAKAAAALEAEQAKGADARSSLVEKLQAVVAAS